jgi:regulator of protease activity HflC (stomatin/prohibitin superfamily)
MGKVYKIISTWIRCNNVSDGKIRLVEMLLYYVIMFVVKIIVTCRFLLHRSIFFLKKLLLLIVGRLSFRVQQINVRVETKTLDNVFLTAVVTVQYQVLRENVYEAFYALTNPVQQIT